MKMHPLYLEWEFESNQWRQWEATFPLRSFCNMLEIIVIWPSSVLLLIFCQYRAYVHKHKMKGSLAHPKSINCAPECFLIAQNPHC